jgi:hypothetical protein
MPNEPGTLSSGEGGRVLISVEDERYELEPKEVKSLIQYGRVVPITASRSRIGGPADEKSKSSISIEGHAAVNRGGKAVVLYTRVGHYIIPLVSFQRVARGEAVSAPLFPLIPESPGVQS